MTYTAPQDNVEKKKSKSFFGGHKKFTVVLLILLGLSVYRFATLKDNANSFAPPQEPVYVELSTAGYGTMRELGLYYGTLSAPNRFSLATKVGGEVKEIRADIGDRISPGDLVAVLDDEEYILARERAELNVKLAEAQHLEASANNDLAKSEMARQKNLSSKNIVSRSEYETAENQLKQTEARLMISGSQLEAARNQLRDAELRLSYARVRASWPGDGEGETGGYRYVGSRLVDAGALVTANTPLFEVVSLDPLLVVVDIIEKDYPKIFPGMEASVRTEAFAGETFKGSVKRVAPILSQDSRQARVEIEVANPGLRLKPGMYAEVIFVFNERRGVWSVNQDVPFRKNEGYVIFVANPETRTVTERRVELGLREGEKVELLDSGPIEGQIVSLGQHLLTDGQGYMLPGDNTRPASARGTANKPGAGKLAS
ncbi:MAG: efflux RND transporter periplasmic adaptor subunit [Deltaproteobacteria bacterium]|jgi:RND family efflux transporter MFP subunit|nr:efflux RND transporter periplasmic adaptor subunit [Deltaproteobacteria bacterium]